VDEGGQRGSGAARRSPLPRYSDPPESDSADTLLRSPAAPLPDDALKTLSGQVLDLRYRVGSRLGEGGMSYVYRAEEIETGRIVALKILLPRLSRDPASVERLRRETTPTSAPFSGWAIPPSG
jgi:serine/threonine protein kinase